MSETDWTSTDGTVRILIGDCSERMRELPDESVHCCVTSPPYWGLRDYGTASWEGGNEECDHRPPQEWIDKNFNANSAFGSGAKTQSAAAAGRWYNPDGSCRCGARRVDKQIGLEKSPEVFVAKMVDVFREVWRILRSDGCCFVNLGDSYCQTDKWGGGKNGSTGKHTVAEDGSCPSWEARRKKQQKIAGIKPKDLVGIPWRVAFALQADGWYLRSDIPWVKRSAMPESVTDRPAKALEYVFLLTKSPKYYFDMEAIKPAASGLSGGACFGKVEQGGPGSRRMEDGENETIRGATRNFRNSDLWYQSIRAPHGMVGVGDEIVGLDVNPFGYKESHFATFPPKLIEPCILAGSSAKGACPACRAPWERVVERTAMVLDRSERTHDKGRTRSSGTMIEPPTSTTLGWQPTCDCPPAEPVPCVILDPFLGSGTTAQVARINGRHAIGCELNPDYAELAKRRSMQTLEGSDDTRPLFASLRQQDLIP